MLIEHYCKFERGWRLSRLDLLVGRIVSVLRAAPEILVDSQNSSN